MLHGLSSAARWLVPRCARLLPAPRRVLLLLARPLLLLAARLSLLLVARRLGLVWPLWPLASAL